MLFLTFLYVFNFTIIKNISYTESAFFVAVILLFKYISINNYSREVNNILKSKMHTMTFAFMSVLIFFSIVLPVICMTFDFSYTSVLLHQFVDLEIGYLLVAMFNYKKMSIIATLIDCFFIQSLIQILCFFSSSITKITDIFRSNSLIAQRTANYLGFRGLAISGSNFFGLAVAYSVIFIVLAFYWKMWKKPIYLKLIYTVCLLFGALSAGRTSIIGIIIFAIVMTIEILKEIWTPKLLLHLVGTIAFLSVLVMFIGVLFGDKISAFFATSASWKRFNFYLFQFLEDDGSNNYKNISSLNHLLDDMYFTLSPSQVIFGDGQYTGSDGSYYMHTDAGYMRNLLFGGLLITVILYLYQYIFIMLYAKEKGQRLFAYFLMLSLTICEIKGQTLGFLIISQCLILLIVHDLDSLVPKNPSGQPKYKQLKYNRNKLSNRVNP